MKSIQHCGDEYLFETSEFMRNMRDWRLWWRRNGSAWLCGFLCGFLACALVAGVIGMFVRWI